MTFGDAVELSTSLDPPDADARIEWYHPGQADVFDQIHPALVPGEHGTTFSFTATGTETDGYYFPVVVSTKTGRLFSQ